MPYSENQTIATIDDASAARSAIYGAVRRVGHGLYVAAETLELAPYAPATPWGGES